MLKRLYSFIFLDLLGWEIVGELPKERKYIIVVAPHTSNWDFLIGVMTRRIRGFDPKFVGKKELFIWPFGHFFRWMGGYPVDRSKHTNFVDSVIALFNEKEDFIITLTPEGTRSYSPDWKSGFYHIAKGADVPVMRCGFDYANKKVVLDQARKVGPDPEECIREYKQYFSQFKGKYPEKGVKWEE